MPRYRFHVLNDTSYALDEEGTELSGLEAMRARATKILGEIIAEELNEGRSTIHLAIMVDDEDGERVGNFRSTTTLVVGENPFAKAK